MCLSGTHNITPTTLWWWAAYTSPQSESTPETLWEGGKCRYGHLRSLRGRMGSLRSYGGPCQKPTRGTDTKTRGFRRRRGGSLMRESLHEGGREFTQGFGDWAAPYGQALRGIENGGWRPRYRKWRHCWVRTRQTQRRRVDGSIDGIRLWSTRHRRPP